LIKVKQVPPNRYAYYLTPKGFTEKSRLTAEYLSSSFNFFRRARRECGEILERCVAHGRQRIALCGTSELGEIAVLCARERDISILGFIALESEDAVERFAGLKSVHSMVEIEPIDAVILTDLLNPQATFEKLRELVGAERIFTPRLLRVTRDDSTVLFSGERT
jgi:hypothetical protein